MAVADFFQQRHNQGQGHSHPESDYTSLVTLLLYYQCDIFFDERVQMSFLDQAISLLSTASNHKQVALVGKEFGFIVNKLTELVCDRNLAMMHIRLLMHSAGLQTQELHTLTPSHTCVLQLCISSGMYTFGASFIRQSQVMAVDPNVSGLTSSDFLRYFYYAGIIFIGVRDFAGASDSFMQILTTPAQAISAIAKEAFKKARLVSLIETGQALELPKYTPNPVLRFSKHDLPVYDAIVTQFVAGNEVALRQVIAEGKELLDKDQNTGLAKQVLAALTHTRIRKLTNTYMTRSLESIASSIGGLSSAAEAEAALVRMISSDGIVASIDQSNGMVRFGKSESTGGHGGNNYKLTDHMLHELEGHLKGTLILCDRLRDLQKRVLSTNTYVAKISGGGGRAGGNASWEEDDEMMDFR